MNKTETTHCTGCNMSCAVDDIKCSRGLSLAARPESEGAVGEGGSDQHGFAGAAGHLRGAAAAYLASSVGETLQKD